MAEDMALEWSDLRVILAVCRAGSLSGAARELGQNHSTVFRRINAIERRTGVRFFERLPSGYFKTDAGESAQRYGERIEAEVHALGREVLGQDLRLQGKVRLTAPEGLAAHIAPGWVAEFCRAHPGVSIELGGGAPALDLGRREADIAIRATRQPPDASLGRKVCRFRFGLYATPDYLEGRQHLPLVEHDWCLLQGVEDWLVPHVFKKKGDVVARGVFTGALALSALSAASAGMGLAMLPCYLGDVEPRLVRASEPLEALTLDLWLLTHPDLRHTARVKALMAFLYEKLLEERALWEGRRVREGWTPPLTVPG